mmetsp:Transcript_24233/g.28552  ORF Transcript_24233/g.28552 Transcript_24233/m.28552 type:complete len:365 (-) Transcript_24233:98-1192(-)
MARRIHPVERKNNETTSEIVTYQVRMMNETPNASEDDLKMRQVNQVALEKNSFDSFESMDEEEGTVEKSRTALPRRALRGNVIQKIGVGVILFAFLVVAKRAFRPSQLQGFFIWMEEHPAKGVIAYTLISPLFMVFLVPAAPLVFGAGFIFKTLFGWVAGVILCSLVTLFGSLLGSIFCFFLGRYWIRKTVRQWSRKYPLFDAIDAAVSDNGFKIMCYLYLTPVLPLGLMSYVIGTTSMPIKPFALARIAALPNTALHVYVGAATGTLFTHSSKGDGSDRFEEVSLSPQIMILGIIVSIISVTLIGMKIKIELQKVLDEQKGKEKDDGSDSDKHTEISTSPRTLLNNVRTRQRHFIPKSGTITS